ncbi:hypothetical protein Pfo_003604 [Paulownia fortunei]|nr:hypothetical protein Pfo_003604 [Paulownia fortunei]
MMQSSFDDISSIRVSVFVNELLGFTQTSKTGGKGTHTADAVAEVGARLALLSVEELPTGKFYVSVSRSCGGEAESFKLRYKGITIGFWRFILR